MAMKKKEILDTKRRMDKHLQNVPKLNDSELLSLARKYFPAIQEGSREELLIFVLRQNLDELFPDNRLW